MITRATLPSVLVAIQSLVLCTGLTACGADKRTEADHAGAQEGPPTIEIARVIRKPVDVTLSMPG